VVMGGRRARRAADLMVGGAGSVGCSVGLCGFVMFGDWRAPAPRQWICGLAGKLCKCVTSIRIARTSFNLQNSHYWTVQ
jgi:hypothetical protein